MLRKIYHTATALLPDPLAALLRKMAGRLYRRSSSVSAHLAPLSFLPRRSFAEAQREAGIGYGHEAMLAKPYAGPAHLLEMQDYSAPMLASIALASASANNRMRVLDFGGGSGFFRAYVNDFFGKSIETEWRVVETPEHVQYSSAAFMPPGLAYSTSIGADRYDFAIFSGSLNYAADWQAVLRETRADMIFIARTPIDDVGQAYLQTVTVGDHVSRFAGHIIEKSALFDLLSETHDLFASWNYQAHMLNMGPFPAPAMLWRRKSADPYK